MKEPSARRLMVTRSPTASSGSDSVSSQRPLPSSATVGPCRWRIGRGQPPSHRSAARPAPDAQPHRGQRAQASATGCCGGGWGRSRSCGSGSSWGRGNLTGAARAARWSKQASRCESEAIAAQLCSDSPVDRDIPGNAAARAAMQAPRAVRSVQPCLHGLAVQLPTASLMARISSRSAALSNGFQTSKMRMARAASGIVPCLVLNGVIEHPGLASQPIRASRRRPESRNWAAR